MSNNKIAENLKKLRAKKGLSLEKIARLADLSLNTIVKVENGANTNPTIETLTKIAEALEVGVDDLIKWGNCRKKFYKTTTILWK